MDKKSFDIVLDEIRKCVLTDQRIRAIELVHGYFSSEQVTEMLKYFSYAEPQIKAVKAMQHKMVAIPTTKVVNILNCFTFSKDKIIVLELIALNISDAQNYRPVEDLFRFHLYEKKRCRRILEQVCKVGCKAPVAMISSCGMIPGNPYPKGRPSQVTGTFPGMPARKEGEELGTDGKGIAARILGPFKPSPSTYNPHRPVPYPIPPCRPHATIAPSRSNNVGLMPVGGVITATVPPPPYSATPNAAAFSRPANQQNSTPGTPTPSSHGSNPPTPSTPHPPNPPSSQAPPTTPITPVFPGLVPSQNTAAASPSPTSSSVIKGPPLSAGSAHIAPSPPSGHSTPVHQSFPGISPSVTPTPSVIKSHTPSATPCGTPVPSGGYSPSPFGGMSRSGTPSSMPTPTSRSSVDPSPSPVASVGLPPYKGYPPTEVQSGSPFAGLPSLVTNSAQSVIRSYTPSAPSARTPTPSQPPTPGRSTPGLPAFSTLPPGPASAAPSPKPSGVTPQAANPASFYGEQHLSALPPHAGGGGSGSNSPVPSAFKGPSRSGTPSLGSLVPNSAAVVRSLNMSRSDGSPQTSLPSPVAMAGLQGLTAALASQPAGSPAPHSLAVPAFPGLSPFSSSPFSGTPPCSAPSSSSSSAPAASAAASPPSPYAGLPHSSAPTPTPFGLGLTTAPSIFPGPNPGFPGFGNSGPQAAGSPVLSPFMGLPGSVSSVATVAPLPAAAVAGVPSSTPVLPRFASAFSSNFNPALVPPTGLTGGLQTPGGAAAFPGLLSFPAVPGFSPSTSPAALSGLHNPAVQSALLQAHSASALESFPSQPNGFTNYPPAPGPPFPLQPGIHPQLGWQ
ncbi:proline and serine-rich protein 1 isoform X1 [Brienomyrus brachyistius]|uniref:proline and serine-rich protein 1 isoform X1 n=1 Tax=Brienomyrus brachyistius TaxID=42636 RepID=UPI0020B4394F|nr:proline and serine-rich protein 1 isoform X1 [Brienomyrus brachyistius]